MDFSYRLNAENDRLFNNYYFTNKNTQSNDDLASTTTTTTTRTRRVTITEIIDETDDWDSIDAKESLHDEDLEDVDEIFQTLSDVVDDWKIKLEWIVAEGLKKMRKSCKEKKTMMKYLPGTKLVGPAKESILMEWRSEFVKTLGKTPLNGVVIV
jgi:hypothetical protein